MGSRNKVAFNRASAFTFGAPEPIRGRPPKGYQGMSATPVPRWLRKIAPLNVRPCWPDGPEVFELPSFGRPYAKYDLGGNHRGAIREGYEFQAAVMEQVRRNHSAMNRTAVLVEEMELFYWRKGRQYKCFADGLYLDWEAGVAIVLECKRTHVADSYRQLWFYMSLVVALLGDGWKVAGFEVCKKEGLTMDYPGECEWLILDKIEVGPFLWDGNGAPKVGIIPSWYGVNWRFSFATV